MSFNLDKKTDFVLKWIECDFEKLFVFKWERIIVLQIDISHVENWKGVL